MISRTESSSSTTRMRSASLGWIEFISLGKNHQLAKIVPTIARFAASFALFGVRRRKFRCRMRLVTPSRLDGTGGASSGLHAQFGQQPLRQNDVTDDE